jgi:site-specific DNA-methyltransferase (adenine-specific)
MEWCLKYYSKEGDKVLDPTMGSGSTGVACRNMNRQFIGIEQDEDIFKIAQSRILDC